MIAIRVLPVVLSLALASLAQRPAAPTVTPVAPPTGSEASNGNNHPNINAYGDNNPIIKDVGGNVTVQYGVTTRQLEAVLKASGKAQQEKIDVLSKQLKTTSDSVRGFLVILNASDVSIEKWPQTLGEIAERYRSMLQRLASLEPEDTESKSTLEQARAILSQAHSMTDYDRADALLAKVEDSNMRAIDEAEALEHEAKEAARRKRRKAGETRAERGELSLTRLDYLQAAQHFKMAAELVEGDRDSTWADYIKRYGIALVRQGNEKGDNAVLGQAIGIYEKALSQLQRTKMPLDWAMTESNLGGALTILGERESGTARLEEAVTAFRQALLERIQKRVPQNWAATQNNLGGALTILGERESGTARLEEAVTAFRQALLEYTREQAPLDWAMTESNLGGALVILGERESGTARLEEAIAAYRQALLERTQERVPLDWATTQNNLGGALTRLGERESGTARLEEAVAAYRQALLERTQQRVPLDWAATQNNLANALVTLGERENGTARLEEAVTVYHQALLEYTRERVPLDWAATQNNLANALVTLGERESGTARLEEAMTAIESARILYKDAGMFQYEKGFEKRLESLQNLIAQRRGK